MKSALGALGLYQAPAWGVSQFPDVALFDAIKAFQKSQGLKVDGAIKPDGETEAALSQAMTPRHAQSALQATAQALQSLGRGGDELLAHITKEEAALLHRVTDGATINPQTGLLEFRFDPSADHKSNQSDSSSTNGSSDDHGQGQGSGPNDYEYEAYHSTPSGPTDKKDSFGGGGKADDDGGQNGDGKPSGDLTGTTQKEGTAKAQSDNARTRRASAKEDSLPGDVLGGDGLSKKDDKKADNSPGYNPDESIEDVETQFKDQLGINPDGTLTNQNEKKAPGRDPKQYWKPGMPPATSLWNGGVKAPDVPQTQVPGTSGRLGSAENPAAPSSNPTDKPYAGSFKEYPGTGPSKSQNGLASSMVSSRSPSARAIGALVDRYVSDPDFRDWVDSNRDAFVDTMSGLSPSDYFDNGSGPGGGLSPSKPGRWR